METIRIQQNQTERIEAYFENTAGAVLSGLTPNLTIRRLSDKNYWTGVNFTSVFTQVSMSGVDNVNQGGLYEYTFDTSGLQDDTYYLAASGTGAANSPQFGELKVGGYIDQIDASIQAASNTIGGGAATVHVKGVFNKTDKERLFSVLAGNFRQLFDFFNILNDKTDIIIDALRGMNNNAVISGLEEIESRIDAQTKLIMDIEETESLLSEVLDE